MKYLKLMIGACAVVFGSLTLIAQSATTWVENDSALAVERRIARDFPYTLDEGLALFRERDPEMTMEKLRKCIDEGLVETAIIDGREMMYRKAVRNYPLLISARSGVCRGATASPQRIALVDTVIRVSKGDLNVGSRHRINYKMWIDVPFIDDIDGDTLRVWMPIPKNSARQKRISVTSNIDGATIYGDAPGDYHTGIFLEKGVSHGENSHFEIDVVYETEGVYFSPDSILAHLQPYNNDDDYKRYTRVEPPHIIDMSDLARKIVGDEDNPFRQSELVYDYIVSHYPWAGAREYSTIPCIPQYVVERGYGDCGQVALLYISLMRSLGVPARWESGWTMMPGEVGIHDWAEVYFEGVGWVPVDVSFGRYKNAEKSEIRNFYSTGIDAYRMAANSGVCGPLGVPKRYIRSETVDQQVGEVETSKGNLFYPLWDYGLKVVSVENF